MKQFLTWIGLIVFTIFSVQAQSDLPEPMSPPRMINDFAKVFDNSQKAELEHIARAYHDSTSTQIYVVTVESLNGYARSDYAARLGEKWGIGQKGKDNGVLILIKPKIGNERGQVYIATGYGVEDRLTDAITGRIIDNRMIPHLQRDNDYFLACKDAMYEIISTLSGRYTSDNPQQTPQSFIDQAIDNVIGFLTCCCLFPLFIFLMIYSKTFRNIVIFMLLLGRGGGSSRGGGFGGGSFGGGGGGRFGGGGAGRSW